MDSQIINNIKRYVGAIDVPTVVSELTKDINDNFLNQIPKRFKKILIGNSSFGTLIGNMADALLPIYLSSNNTHNLTFIKGNDTRDPDCVCVSDPFFNTEGKTTCNKNQRINGAKTNAGIGQCTKYQNDDYHFYIFIAFNKSQNEDDDLTVANVWVGMLKPSDWSISESRGSGGSWLTNEMFDNRFINIRNLLKD